MFFFPNVAPDVGLSAPFNPWFTFFGQFFDHGLDLVTKGGNEIVFIPLQPDDPLFVAGQPDQLHGADAGHRFCRAGADGIIGTADDTVEHQNTTSPFVDQNQTYTSHPSHQVFLRAYELVDVDAARAHAPCHRQADHKSRSGRRWRFRHRRRRSRLAAWPPGPS